MWFMSKFIKDFLNLSNKTFQESFGVTKITLPRVRTYNVKFITKGKNAEVKLFTEI